MHTKKVTLVLFALLAATLPTLTTANNRPLTLTSPDKKMEIHISLDQELTFSLLHEGETLLRQATIAMQLGDGNCLGEAPRRLSAKTTYHKESITSPFYRCEAFEVEYNQLDLALKGYYGVLFRAYNDGGIAYRFYTKMKQPVEVVNERADYLFAEDYPVYLSHSTNPKQPMAMAFQNTYATTPLSEADTLLAFLPATLDCGGGRKLTLLESDLEAYPGMFLQASPGKQQLSARFAQRPAETDYYPWRKQLYVTQREERIATAPGSRSYPWRIFALTTDDRQMPLNHLVYALASPNRIDDYSWVVPGKAAWEWWNNWGLQGVGFKAGINTTTYKYFIDFAARYGVEYIILDEGWYSPASGDMLTTIEEIDLPEIIRYGKEQGVGVILWTVFNVLDDRLEETCRHYSRMGVKGFKIDFLDRDDQTAVEMIYRIAEATARHQLVVDLHGVYKPTGLNRTYPHILNFEALFGMEEVKWSQVERDMPLYDVTFPFIRMMSGPVDYTPGAMRNANKTDFQPIYRNPASMGTRAHQLAAYVVYDSPLTMLCDAPTAYEREPEYSRFLTSIPVVTDETRVVEAKMGEYIVTARRCGKLWHIAGMTNWTAREVVLSFDLLPAGERWRATLVTDGINVEQCATDYRIEEFEVTASDSRTIRMAPGGGFVIRLEAL